MSINDVWMLSVIGSNAGQQHIHTLHFLEQGPATTGAQLVTAWLTACDTTYRACFQIGQSPVTLLRAQKVCGAVPLPAAHEEVPISANQAGTRPSGSSELMPPFLACLVAEKSALAGRRYSGRFFLGGMSEADVNQSTLQPAYIAIVQAYVSALYNNFVAGVGIPWRLFAFSRLLAEGDPNHMSGGLPDPVAAVQCQDAGAPVATLVISPYPTTMRSRKLGHGI